jgi:hypothetical protein
MNVDGNADTSSAIVATNIATFVGRDQHPVKKRRGRINSSNPGLRDKPVTPDGAYELVETDENDRAQKQSNKIRAVLSERTRREKNRWLRLRTG